MLHHLLKRTLCDSPDRQVLEFHGRFWTAGELDESARKLAANLLKAGVEATDRVAVLLPNCPQTVLTYLACFKANFVIVPLDYRHQSVQIAYALSHSGASVFIVHCERVAELEAAGLLASVPHVLVVEGEPVGGHHRSFEEYASRNSCVSLPESIAGDSLCVMIYTSGTTSRPKGVTLTRDAMVAGIKKYVACVPLCKNDTALVAAPITRPMALRSQLLPVLYVGGRVSLIERFTVADYLSALQRPPAKTFLALLPSALQQLLAHPDINKCDFSALRLCIAGGDRVPPQLQEQFAKITGVPITEQCGASEVGPYAMNPPFGRKKLGSIGLPMYGTQVCVVNEQGDDATTDEIGEIVVSSPMMMEGYWNDTAMTRKMIQNGRIRTGDLGRFDNDGYLWFMGRKKDIIVRGGSNISPLEVETVLLDHPAVAEACVIGILNTQWGQAVHAFIVPKAGVTSEELLEFSRSRLAEYMLPQTFHFLDHMPDKGPGKVDRDLLKMRAEIRPLIEKVSFFKNASDKFIRDIVPRLECKQFDATNIIFRQGEVGDAMYFLTSGRVEVLREDLDKPLAVLSEGAYFGEVAILREAPRFASIRAISDCEVYELRRTSVLELARAHPEFAQHLESAIDGYDIA